MINWFSQEKYSKILNTRRRKKVFGFNMFLIHNSCNENVKTGSFADFLHFLPSYLRPRARKMSVKSPCSLHTLKFTFPFLYAGHIFMSSMHGWVNKKMTGNFSDLSALVFDVYLILLINKSLHIFVIWINKSYQREHFLYRNEKNPPTYKQLNLVEIFGYSIPHIGSEPELFFEKNICLWLLF